MKLIDILVDAGDETPLFGVHTKYLAMDPDGRVHGYCEMPSPTALGWGVPDALYSTDGRGCLIQIDRDDVDGQWQSAIITREQYESALAAKNDAWIEWGGGECPVPRDTLVEVKFPDGITSYDAQPAGSYRWTLQNCLTDIAAYRLHQPQEVEQAEADDEADLNECIGHGMAPVWNGEGLPPVGCVCERSWAGDKWLRCEIIFTGNEIVLVKLATREAAYHLSDVRFRPIRSEAERKREEAVKAITLTGWCQTAAEEIYDLIAAGKVPGMKLED